MPRLLSSCKLEQSLLISIIYYAWDIIKIFGEIPLTESVFGDEQLVTPRWS